MLALILMSVMVAVGVGIANRLFPAHRWKCGVWFALLAIIADTCARLSVGESGFELSLRDGPVIAAALFFGPTAGIVAGALATLECILLPLFGIGSFTWIHLSTFLISLLAAAVGYWFLDRRRPALVQAMALAFIFEGLHLVFDLLLAQEEPGLSCEIAFNTFFPEAFVLMATMALSTIVVRSVGTLAENFVADASRILLAFVVFDIIVTQLAYNSALFATTERGSDAKRRLQFLFDSQIDFMIHHDALHFADALGTLRDMTTDEVNRLITGSRYDELVLVDPTGVVRAANDQKLYAFNFSTHPKASRYLRLTRGEELYIGEPFRASGLDGVNIKYGGVALTNRSGFIQIGYTRSRMESEFSRFFFPVFDQDIRVFESDFYLIASTNDGQVVVSSRDEAELEGRTVDQIGIQEGNFSRVLGTWCFVDTITVGEWRIYCMLPIAETYGPAAVQCGIVLILIFAFMFFFRMVMLRFHKQREKIDQLRAEADERMHKDLLNAQKIQLSFLPEVLPSGDDFTVTAQMLAAREVGGDFYDGFALRDGRIALVVADVSGKGVPAAMFMTKAKSLIQIELLARTSLTEAVACANDKLCQQNYAEMFVTAWIGIWDPLTGDLEYVNAGHNPPLVRRADGAVDWIRNRGGIALAAMPGARYRTHEFTLGPNDELLLYTDGVTEAMNAAGELYGEERLERYFSQAGKDVVNGLFSDVADFAGGAEQSDDITALHLSSRKAD